MPKDTSWLTADFIRAAINYHVADIHCDVAWRALSDSVAYLSDERYLKLLSLFRAQVDYFYNKKGYKDVGIRRAADEFCRRGCVQSSEETYAYTVGECVSFYRTYAARVDLLRNTLVSLFDVAGDTFEDITDAMPLFGDKFCRRRFTSEDSVLSAGKRLPLRWRDFIGHEHYICMALACACRQFAVGEALQI